MKKEFKKIRPLLWLIAIIVVFVGNAYGQTVKSICKYCKVDTTGGFISIEDTVLHNPYCNYEVLTAAHVAMAEKLKISRKGIAFYPSKLNACYDNSGDDRGHVISWEDLAYTMKTAMASYDLRRNLAPEPHLQNVGTKYASEQLGRQLATQYGSVIVYGGTTGSVGNTKGINEPKYYWTIIVTPHDYLCYLMPTTGAKIGKKFLNDPEIKMSEADLSKFLGFDPMQVIKAN